MNGYGIWQWLGFEMLECIPPGCRCRECGYPSQEERLVTKIRRELEREALFGKFAANDSADDELANTLAQSHKVKEETV